jgi:hypothetical protein
MLKAHAAGGEGPVTLRLQGGLRPTVFTGPAPRYTQVIMPLKLKGGSKDESS